MASRLSVCIKSFVLGALLIFQSFAASILPLPHPIPVYPQYRLAPVNPTAQDSVSFQLVKGTSGVSCVPVYGTSFGIEQEIALCKMAPCPPLNVIKISYRELEVETFAPIPCYTVQTEYGPNFNFGKLPAGSYTIIDTTDSNRTLMQFTVADSPKLFTISGKVTEDVGMSKVLITVTNAKVYLRKPLYYIMPLYAMPFIPDSILDSTVSDAQGAFSFKNVKQDSYTLSISATGYQPKDIPLSITSDAVLSISLLPVNALGRIAGTVYQATPPGVVGCGYSPVGCVVGTVEGCTVSVNIPLTIILPMESNAQAFLPTTVYKAVTNGQGAYTIDSIPLTYADRTITVVARKDGFTQDGKTAVMQPDQFISVNFALQRPYANRAEKTVNNVTYSVATDKASYNVGENINVRYTIKNNSSAAVIDSLPCCRENLLAMTPSGDTAYHRDGLPCPCPPVVPPVSITPGDSMVSDFTPFTYADTARSLTIIAKLGWNEIYSYYSTPAVSVLVGINQAGTPVLQRNIQKTLMKNTPIVTYSRSSKTLAITSDRPQLISITAYMLNGRKIPELSGNQLLGVGPQSINVKNAARYGGIVLFRIQGEGFVETARINLIN